MSCYIPAYTRINGRKQETACGRWVDATQHSNEPDCHECRVFLLGDAADAEETYAALGYVHVDGVWVPKEEVR